jgi:pre-peptidase
MHSRSWWRCLPAAVITLGVLLGGARADDKTTADGGKAEAFKGKTFDLKAKGKATITLEFPAGKPASVTVRSENKTDVHLYVYDANQKVVAKDDSPGPSCDLTFTPKVAGKYTLEVSNLGPGENRSTLKVSFGK